MLYERWSEVARQNHDRLAVRDLANERDWTFGQLAEAAAHQPVGQGIATPQGQDISFVLEVLSAWRDRRVLCPLEAGQPRPALLDDATPLPRGTAHLKFTSATSGPAKGVALTAAQLAADADQIVATMGLRQDWPNLAVISLAHSYGFSNLVTPLLLHGIPLILAGSPLPENLQRAAAGFPAVTLPAVPALWRVWHEGGAIPGNVRLAISAGAPLPLPLEQAVFQSKGLKIHNFIGASECGGIAYDSTATTRTDGAWAGTPMQGVKLSVTTEGCLEVISPAAGLGYWPVEDARFGEGRLITSDLAEVRTDGLWLRGRAGDVINVAGRKVSPEAVERVLQTHPSVAECLVVGLPAPDSDGRGEQIVAVIVLRNEATREALRLHVMDQLPAWQAPREWRFVESLSPNQRGKLSRAEWRQRLLNPAASR